MNSEPTKNCLQNFRDTLPSIEPVNTHNFCICKYKSLIRRYMSIICYKIVKSLKFKRIIIIISYLISLPDYSSQTVRFLYNPAFARRIAFKSVGCVWKIITSQLKLAFF